MLMALALYSGKFSGMGSEYLALFRWGSLLIATPTVFWTGNVFFRGGLAALRTRTPHMDLPVSLGILAGYVGSAINTVRARGDIYFDSLCTLIFLLLVGRYLQRTHQRRSAKASELISALAPISARLVDGESLREVPASTVLPGSIVHVLPGERIAVDGVVSEGASAIDSSLLTGESLPQEVSVGDRVYAGTKNHARTLRVRVESSGSETRLGQLMHSVETTQRERAPIVRLADRVGWLLRDCDCRRRPGHAAALVAHRSEPRHRPHGRATRRDLPVRARYGDAARRQRGSAQRSGFGDSVQRRRIHRGTCAARADCVRQDRHAHRRPTRAGRLRSRSCAQQRPSRATPSRARFSVPLQTILWSVPSVSSLRADSKHASRVTISLSARSQRSFESSDRCPRGFTVRRAHMPPPVVRQSSSQ
jgi:hypothetical protein